MFLCLVLAHLVVDFVLQTNKMCVDCRLCWEKIVRLLGENPYMTTASLSEALGISTTAVERHISRLKADGIISRIGPDKGGHWNVNHYDALVKAL